MTSAPINDYVNDVARHLKLRGPARRQALDDLRDALTEAAEAVDEAIAAAGAAADYAASLDEQFGTSDGAFQRIAGMPNSLGKGFGRRMAGTFAPGDHRLFVPRVFGIGWAINMGAVAVRLGLLRPDDVDDEILTEAADQLRPALVAAAVPICLGAVGSALLVARRDQVETATGRNQSGNIAVGITMNVFASGLLAAAANREVPAEQRLTMPGIAAGLGLLTAGTSTQYALRPSGQTIVLAACLAALPSQFLLSYLPVRSVLRRRWASLDRG